MTYSIKNLWHSSIILLYFFSTNIFMRVCGIDEAGRGPIVGPLVLAGVLIEEEDEAKLKAIGVKDSKLIKEKDRERLFDQVKKIVKKHVIISLSPQEVDNAVQGNLNLNGLEQQKSAEIINQLQPEKAIVDSPSNNVKAYRSSLSEQVHDKKTELIVEHKADMNHVVVGAASILAKVTRDRAVKEIKKKLNIDFGSGYLSDPKTAKFLEEHWENHDHVFRKSWAPYKERMNKKFQSSLEDFSTFMEDVEEKNKDVMEKLKKLQDFGYEFVPTSTEHEHVRMKGTCTITLYKNGKLLIQGKEEKKKAVEKLLK